MNLISGPPAGAVDTQSFDGTLTPPTPAWRHFFSDVFTICSALTQAGTTAQRPVRLLWVGRVYFDTDLGPNGKPIWLASVTPPAWVTADGLPA
jgi:hypothetical protein